MVPLIDRELISNARGHDYRQRVKNCADSALLNSVTTPEQRTQRGVNRLVGRNQRQRDEPNAFARGQHGRVVHLPIDTRFQQEVRESPDIV